MEVILRDVMLKIDTAGTRSGQSASTHVIA
jgi:hypothetical protein